MPCDIAIVGMSCRFPEAPDIQTFWKNNLEKRVSLKDLSNHRWDHGSFYDANIRVKNKSHTQTAGLIHDIDMFDARRYDVSPRMARSLDPQQRLSLELAREALQDAGLEQKAFDKGQSSVFLGASVSEYAGLLALKVRSKQLEVGQFGEPCVGDSASELPDVNSYFMAGCLVNMIASGVAHTFGFGGPASTVDAACASSLAAVVQGCNYLNSLPSRDEVSPISMVGGVYLMLHPDNAVCFAKLGALAERECRPFDVQSGGFILGEGGGLFVLKRLEDANADQDRIYAVIRSASWNNDGGTNRGPMSPSREGQERLLRQGFKAAGLSPTDIGYVECHGTATTVGDRTEIAALSDVWTGEHRPALGSVKANIGHTLSAAGAASLLRASLALFHRALPPQAGWAQWNPDLEEYSDKFQISTEAREWEGPSGATVSSFGFGGTNCFVVLQPVSEPDAQADDVAQENLLGFFAPDRHLLKQYLIVCRPFLESQSINAVAEALASRKLEEQAIFLRGNSAPELLQNLERALAMLDENPDEISADESMLIGSTLELKDLSDARWADAAKWCSGTAPRFSTKPGNLPPSPIQRKSYWATSELPGPRSEAR